MLFRIAVGLVISAIVPATLLAQVRDNGVRRVPQHQPVLQQPSGVQINLKPGFSVLPFPIRASLTLIRLVLICIQPSF